MSTEVEIDGIFQDDVLESDLVQKYLLFRIGEEEYGVAIQNIQSIEELQKITVVPDLSDHIKGVINLRGQVIPVMDLRLRFGLPERAYDDRTCIVILNLSDVTLGIIVDTVSEVKNIPEEQIDDVVSLGDLGSTEKFVKGLGKIDGEVKILLDITRILGDEERKTLVSAELAKE